LTHHLKLIAYTMKGVNIKCICCTILLFYSAASSGYSQKHSWTFEFSTALVYNLPLPLKVEQKGYEDIHLSRALYSSYPLSFPIYFDIRISKWRENKCMSFEVIHHKIYLDNTPPEIQGFGISHGFNMVMIDYGQRLNKMIVRGGIGVVLAHAESTVRGMEYPYERGFDIKGYRIRFPVLSLSLSRPIELSKAFFVNTEFKINGASIQVPVVNGNARVNLVVFQFVFGPGYALY
jgi:hypothetical protein